MWLFAADPLYKKKIKKKNPIFKYEASDEWLSDNSFANKQKKKT